MRHGISMEVQPRDETDRGIVEVEGFPVIPMQAIPPICCLCGWSAETPTQPQPASIAAVHGTIAGLMLEAILHLDSILPEELS
jgi:hypothetical protein